MVLLPGSRIAQALILLPTLLVAISCGNSTYETMGSRTALGADATIEVEKLDGGNVQVTFEAEHLPPPSRLAQGLQVYVMWFIPDNAPAQLVSMVAYDEDDREGSATATTMHRKLEVRVTAERSVNVSTPSEHVVIKQMISGRE